MNAFAFESAGRFYHTPIDPFTISEPRNPSLDIFHVV